MIWHREPERNEWFRILVGSPVGAHLLIKHHAG